VGSGVLGGVLDPPPPQAERNPAKNKTARIFINFIRKRFLQIYLFLLTYINGGGRYMGLISLSAYSFLI